MSVNYRVGVDIGGTFTDIVLLGTDGTIHTKKVSSSVDNYARAIVEGLVEVRPGSGIHVVAREPAASAPRLEPSAFGPFEIIRARQLIESELAAYAALHMRRPQVAGLREAIEVMQQEAAASHTPTEGDRLFHTRIAEACENSVLLRVVSELFDERHNPLFEQLGSHFETAHSWADAIEEHRAVVDAIAHQSPQGAREAMARHLANSHDRFMAGWQAESATPARPAVRKRKVTR